MELGLAHLCRPIPIPGGCSLPSLALVSLLRSQYPLGHYNAFLADPVSVLQLPSSLRRLGGFPAGRRPYRLHLSELRSGAALSLGVAPSCNKGMSPWREIPCRSRLPLSVFGLEDISRSTRGGSAVVLGLRWGIVPTSFLAFGYTATLISTGGSRPHNLGASQRHGSRP